LRRSHPRIEEKHELKPKPRRSKGMKSLALTPEQQKTFDEHTEWALSAGKRMAARYGVPRDWPLVENYILVGLAEACKVDKPVAFKKIASTRVFASVIQSARDNGPLKRSAFARRQKKPETPTVLFGLGIAEGNGRHVWECVPVDPRPRPDMVEENRDEVAHLCAYLDAQELEVIRRFYYGDENQVAIAKAMGVSEGRISQLHRTALEKMREAGK
jgi:RNA polymerase sigma factor (sigma-70 family)